jgi:uncharacterized membrane protein (UPF0127 family)
MNRIWSIALTVYLSLVFIYGLRPPVYAEPANRGIVSARNVSADRLRTAHMTVGKKIIQASIADTEESRIRGLLGWDRITEDQGMLLDFVLAGQYAIHMQGMKFPIDALWIDDNGAIVLIYDSIQPNSGRIYPSMFPSRYCLELKAGFCKKYDVRMGTQVVFGVK